MKSSMVLRREAEWSAPKILFDLYIAPTGVARDKDEGLPKFGSTRETICSPSAPMAQI